jgi:hypothetical protein
VSTTLAATPSSAIIAMIRRSGIATRIGAHQSCVHQEISVQLRAFDYATP